MANYTYLLVKGKGPAYWIAVSSTEIGVGEKITYTGRYAYGEFLQQGAGQDFRKGDFPGWCGRKCTCCHGGYAIYACDPGVSQGSTVKSDKLDITIEAEEGIVTIGELYADPGAYEGKTIRVRGEVAKYNPGYYGAQLGSSPGRNRIGG